MDLGGVDVATEIAATNSYRTYSDMELLYKCRIEAEGAITAQKRLQCLRISKKENRKCTRDHVSLCN